MAYVSFMVEVLDGLISSSFHQLLRNLDNCTLVPVPLCCVYKFHYSELPLVVSYAAEAVEKTSAMLKVLKQI